MQAINQTGLSTCHKRTLEISNPAKVSYYQTGSLATASRATLDKECIECGELFTVSAYRAYQFSRCNNCREHRHKCVECGAIFYIKGRPEEIECPECGAVWSIKRGIVSEFSAKSRRRLMRHLATLDKDVRPAFVTLTFSDAYTEYQDSEHWKIVLKRFTERVRRKYPQASFIWRLELIDRKSGEHIGELFPHFHCLFFGVPYSHLRAFVPLAWFESVGTGDIKHLQAGTQVKPVLSRRGIFRYASKTVATVAHGMSGELGKTRQAIAGSFGRFWGIAIRENWKSFLSALVSVELEDTEAVTLVRYFRRLAHLKGRAYDTLTAFFNGEFMSSNLSRILYPPTRGRCYRATGRRYDIPFYAFMLGGNADESTLT